MLQADMVGQRPLRAVGPVALANGAVEGAGNLPSKPSLPLDVFLDEFAALDEGRGTLMRL